MRTRAVKYLILAASLLAIAVLLRDASWRGSTELHTLMEAVATLLALVAGAIAFVRYYSRKDSAFLYLGAGLVGTGLLDASHATVTSRWFAQLWPSPPVDLSPWSWAAPRTFLAILLCFMVWTGHRRGRRPVSEHSVFAVVGALLLGCFILFAVVPLPTAHFPELPTVRPQELVAAAFFGLALLGHARRRAWQTDGFEDWLMISIIVGLGCQVFFMPFSVGLFDAMFDAAHLLKIVSYGCVLAGLLDSIHDVFTQEAAARAALAVQNVALARSNRELEQFAAIASHDLQEPLRKIQAFGDRLQTRHADQLDEAGLDYVQRMLSAGVRMKALVESLLTLSRVSTRAKPFEPTSLNDVVAEVCGDLVTRINETSSQVTIDRLPTIECDPVQMQQLFQNLIANAIKFRRDDVPPRVTICDRQRTAGRFENGAGANGGHCQIEIQDNGIGFESKHQERIFALFQKLHARTRYEGTGIGLAVCRKIVERHNGTILARSTPGEGTAFVVSLPLQQPKERLEP